MITETTKPMVSVVMITYNHEAYIAEAIEGVLMQNCDFNLELIIANDNSPDNTDEIVQNYINTHPKGHWIKYHRHAKNLGMMPNFEFAMNKAESKYIALCDGDDYWTDPNKLQKQFTFLEANLNYVLCGHDADKINEKGETIQTSVTGELYSNDCDSITLMKGYGIPTLSMFFRNYTGITDSFKKVKFPDMALKSILGQYGTYHFDNTIGNAKYRITNHGTWNQLQSETQQYYIALTYLTLSNYYSKKNIQEIALFLKVKSLENYNASVKSKLSNANRQEVISLTVKYWLDYKNITAIQLKTFIKNVLLKFNKNYFLSDFQTYFIKNI